MTTGAPATTAEAQRRPLRADAQRNYDRLIESARETFTELGGDTPLEEVARRAGVGIGTLYRHFPTRLDLLESIYRDDVDRLSVLARSLTAELGPWDAMVAWLEEFSTYAATKRVLLHEIVNVAGRDAEVLSHSRVVIAEAADLVIGGAQRAGVVRTDVDFSDVTRLVGGCTMMPGVDMAQQKRMLKLVLDGLRVPA
jgi:AcrR family transcriptional regulator